MFLLYKNEAYSYEPDRKNPWTYSWLTMDGDDLEELFSECGFTKDKPYLHMDDFDTIAALMSQIVNSFGENMGYYFERSALMLLILSKMIQQNKKEVNRGRKREKRRSFRTVVSYIRDNYMIDLDVGKIASSVFLSESYVKHLFIELADMSLTTFLNRYRISKACILLRQSPKISGEQLARQVGYDNYAYFARLFKKYCSVSAREYRLAPPEDDPFEWVQKIMLQIFNEEEIDWLK